MVDGQLLTDVVDVIEGDWFTLMLRPIEKQIVLHTHHFHLHMVLDDHKFEIMIPKVDIPMFGKCITV